MIKNCESRWSFTKNHNTMHSQQNVKNGIYTLTAQKAGNSQGMVEVLNVSTGIYARGGSSKLGGEVLALACDASGQLLWAGNNKVNNIQIVIRFS